MLKTILIFMVLIQENVYVQTQKHRNLFIANIGFLSEIDKYFGKNLLHYV